MSDAYFEGFVGSVAGPHHRKNDIPNQDVAHWYDAGDLFIGAVADGAGSLKHSDVGAFQAAKTAVEAIHEALKTTPFDELIPLGIEAGRTAQVANDDYKEFGSTLTLVVMKSNGDWTAGGVGDSFGVIHMEDDSHELVTGTAVGEYANITELLTSKSIHPLYATGTGAIGFSLSSDGLENVALSKGEAHPGFWNGIRDKAIAGDLEVSALFDWLDSLDRIVDDTTLLTAVKR
jgi:hypothetical protein